jgi:hypothetical protein
MDADLWDGGTDTDHQWGAGAIICAGWGWGGDCDGTGAADSSPARRRRAPGGGGGAILAPSYGRAVVRARPTPRRRRQGRSHCAPRLRPPGVRQGAHPFDVVWYSTLLRGYAWWS